MEGGEGSQATPPETPRCTPTGKGEGGQGLKGRTNQYYARRKERQKAQTQAEQAVREEALASLWVNTARREGRSVSVYACPFIDISVPHVTRLGHPAVLPVYNLSVQRMPNDTPVSLSSDELAVISLGPRFIPVARDSLRASEWSEAIALFEHRIAVHLMFDGVPFPERRVDTTLVTMQYQRSTSGLFELEKGPLKDRVLDLSRKVLRACNEQAGTRTSARTNLSPGQLHALHTLKSRRDIVCRPCDKGLGPCVMTREWYNTAARALLSDRKSYEVLPASTTIADLVCKVYCEFDALLERFDFSAGRRASPTSDEIFGDRSSVGVGEFYILPKLHKYHAEKAPYPARPIVADVNGATTVASRMVSDVLQRVIQQTTPHEWILTDTLQLLNFLPHVVPLEGDILFSLDVVSLYPSIPCDLALGVIKEEVDLWEVNQHNDACARFTAAHRVWSRTHVRPEPTAPTRCRRTSELVCSLLGIILEHSYLAFDDGEVKQLLKQLQGLTMGTACAPPIANLVMYHLVRSKVRSMTASGKLVYMKGFIDDVQGLFRGTLSEFHAFVQELNALHPNIQFTETHSFREVPFLDVVIYVDTHPSGERRLCTRPYTKEYNRFLYIPRFSGHAPHSLTNFIASEAQRLIRNSSKEADAVLAARDFAHHLLARGYDAHTIQTQLNKVSFAQRHLYLARKCKDSGKSACKTIALTLTYRPLVAKLGVQNMLRPLQQGLGKKVKLLVGWRSDKNLQSRLGLQWPRCADPQNNGDATDNQ